MKTFDLMGFGIVAASVLFACSSSDDKQSSKQADIELMGSYSTDFGDETITDSDWSSSSYAPSIVSYDNDLNFAVLQDPDDGMGSGITFEKRIWTEPKDGAFAYCTVDFGLKTADDAKASTKTADASDLDKGCSGFSWTQDKAK